MSKAVGRPTKLVPETVGKLKEILEINGTVEEACAYARIAKDTYYAWLKENEDFRTEMESAKKYIDIAAKRNVGAAIKKKDLNTSKWHLEKTQYNKESLRVGMQDGDKKFVFEVTRGED